MALSGLMRTHHNGELTEKNNGEKVVLCGWVNKSRNLGSLYFIDIRDKFGMTQLSFDKFEGDRGIFKNISLESVIQAEGIVRLRPTDAINTDMATGKIEIEVIKLTLLSKAQELPFLPSAMTEASEDLRLKYRYLDMRSNKLQSILSLRSQVYTRVRTFLGSQNFVEVETPILYKSTPEGARDYVVPSRVHKGKVYALPQSPQTLKQLLMIGSLDKYFQICKCFRDEDLRAERQPEFTQIDIEVSFPTEEYMKNLALSLVRKIFEDETIELPTMSYDEAIELYGSDKPDVRFGLKHLIVTEVFKKSSFKLFQDIALASGLIKAIYLDEQEGTLTRKDIDNLVEVVKPYGCSGVAWFKVTQSEVSGGISKFIDEEILSLLDNKKEKRNGLWLFVAHTSHKNGHDGADALRRYLGKHCQLIDKNMKKFLWVNRFPLFEYSPEDGRYYAAHHPFTSPATEDLELFLNGKTGLDKIKAQAYDVICNGYELGGGSLRIFNDQVQSKMFELLGIEEEERERQFGFFIEALKFGTPPHGGIAFGLDRTIMILAGTDNIRDVIAFPKTNSATDLMASAPSYPNEKQWEELGISPKNEK